MRRVLILSVLLLASGCVSDRHSHRPHYYGGPPARVYAAPPPPPDYRGPRHYYSSEADGRRRNWERRVPRH